MIPPADRHGESILHVRELRTLFGTIAAVDGVSLRIPPAKTVALVGESGCGKSVTALSIMRLLPEPTGRIAGGQILLGNRTAPAPLDLVRLSDAQMQQIRGGRIAMIFQEPLSALNPVLTVGQQIIEAVELHQGLRGRAGREEAIGLLRRVGIGDAAHRIHDYPHQMSGGMRQRAMIAMALACRPSLLIADEPTTALDVTVQAQILDLLRALQQQAGLSILLITHDLGVVAQIAEYVYVMYAGRIVEHAATRDIYARPQHPYTQALMRCTPRMTQRDARLEVIPGRVPDPVDRPTGCAFHPRCTLTGERAAKGDRETLLGASARSQDAVLRRCVEEFGSEPSGEPTLREIHAGHFVACWEAD